MNILLVRPDPGNDRFGLGPFFCVEPLGMLYIGAALRAAGHVVELVDLRFGGSVARSARRLHADIVGISCMHALEYDMALACATAVKRAIPSAHVVLGGHAAAAFPAPLLHRAVDSICTGDGETVMPLLVAALARGESIEGIAGLQLPRDGVLVATQGEAATDGLEKVGVPARDLVAGHRHRYHCLLFKPVWLVETARGCPFRCDFCSVWQLHRRKFRSRSIGQVVADMEAVGDSVFIVDDLFWHEPERSLELARELLRRGVRKKWILVQTRTDLAVRHANLLEAWRPLARDFDIFFGLEAATDQNLDKVVKDNDTADTIEAARVARSLRYGVTGNFLVDPDWEESDFEKLWSFVDEHDFHRAGYTILTPLPGTSMFARLEDKLKGQPWFKYDMHHALWEPRLGARRFFELYAQTWKRSILNIGGRKSLTDWMRQVELRQAPYIVRVMLRTQKMMRAGAYLREHECAAAAP